LNVIAKQERRCDDLRMEEEVAQARLAPVEAMRQVWHMDTRWEFGAANGICGVVWDCARPDLRHLPSNLPDDLLVVSLHRTPVDCVEVRLDGAPCHNGRLAAGSWMVVPSSGAPEALTEGVFSLLHLYVSRGLLRDVAAEYDTDLSPARMDECRTGRFDQHTLAATCQRIDGGATIESDALARLSRDRMAQALVADMVALFAEDAGAPSGPETLTGPRARRVEALVAARLGEAITLDDMARAAGLSRSHFLRAYKARFGETPMARLRHLRLERAMSLLRTTDASIGEIALATGFADQSHLSRHFKRLYGRPPGAIRSEIRATRR
jgi:AraC-like DNA-binding protein